MGAGPVVIQSFKKGGLYKNGAWFEDRFDDVRVSVSQYSLASSVLSLSLIFSRFSLFFLSEVPGAGGRGGPHRALVWGVCSARRLGVLS